MATKTGRTKTGTPKKSISRTPKPKMGRPTKSVSTPKRDGSGRGTRANKGRAGCATPKKVGKGKR